MNGVFNIQKSSLFYCIKRVIKHVKKASEIIPPEPFNSLVSCRWTSYKTTSTLTTNCYHCIIYGDVLHTIVYSNSGRPQSPISFYSTFKETENSGSKVICAAMKKNYSPWITIDAKSPIDSLAAVLCLVTKRSSPQWRSVAWRDTERLRGRLNPQRISEWWPSEVPQQVWPRDKVYSSRT